MNNSKMLRTAVAVVSLLVAAPGFTAGGGGDYDSANIDPGNIASLQRGAANFMNYCSGCHSAQYVRYNTIGKHLELTEEQLIENLMFNADKTFETIRASMSYEDGARWYGKAPPDLSLIARSKGADYIYTFLRGYYVEASSPTGVNNTVLAGTSMPHVLWELQGFREAVFAETTEDGITTKAFEGFEPLTAGSMEPEDFDAFVRDTVNFLVYIAEPIRGERQVLGVWVMLYLIVFLILAIMLKKQIWKDVK